MPTKNGRKLIPYDVSGAPSSDPGTWPTAKNGPEPKPDGLRWPIYSADELGTARPSSGSSRDGSRPSN
jgi:hypothetical protein